MENTDIAAAERLRAAREKAGFRSAAAAARANGWSEGAYRHHENGTRGFGFDQSRRYADAFKVSVSWLIFGSTRSDTVRVPMAAFYIKLLAENLGEETEVWNLIDGMFVKLGFTMFPELSIDDTRVEWLIGPDGLPPMHFISASELPVSMDTITEGFVFAFRLKARFPRHRFNAGDLVLVDSSVERPGQNPAFYLFRDEDGPIIYLASHAEDGDVAAVNIAGGTPLVRLSDLEPISMVGRIVWAGQPLT